MGPTKTDEYFRLEEIAGERDSVKLAFALKHADRVVLETIPVMLK